MNCTQALGQLLDADLVAPTTDDDRALAAHIAECGRCARAAATLRSGTMALAQAVARERVISVRPAVAPRGVGWFAPRFALVGAALAVIGIVVSRTVITEPALPATAVAPRLADDVGAPARPTHRAPRIAPALPTVELAPEQVAPERVDPERVDPRFFAAEPVKVAAVEATPFVHTNSADALPVTPENRADAARLPEITVTNRLGTHAMVSRTADPNIVVVWLSAEPNRRIP